MDTINVDYTKLSLAIMQIDRLCSGTGMQRYVTSELMNHSRGKTYESLNQLYKELGAIEDAFINLVKQTKEAMTKAGISFEEAERTVQEIISQILPQSIGGR